MHIAKTSLKKQSQFTPALTGVTPFMKGDYGEWTAAGAEENKANLKMPIGHGVDSRFCGNDKYGIPARRKNLTLLRKTKPISIRAK